MDVDKILADLRMERMQIEEAILSLERLAKDRVKRRGRPPKWMAEAKKRVRAQAKRQEGPSRSAAA
jgi:hypothetical protein